MSHTLVWIDHHEAKIFEIARGGDQPLQDAGPQVIQGEAPRHHLRHKTGHQERHNDPIEQAFLSGIAEALGAAVGILIVGLGQARAELSTFLHEKFPPVAANVWAVESMDHPTDAEIAAYGRKYFRAAERMQS